MSGHTPWRVFRGQLLAALRRGRPDGSENGAPFPVAATPVREDVRVKGTALIGDVRLNITGISLQTGQIVLRCEHPGRVATTGRFLKGELVRIFGGDATSIATCRLPEMSWDGGWGPDLRYIELRIRMTDFTGESAWPDAAAALR